MKLKKLRKKLEMAELEYRLRMFQEAEPGSHKTLAEIASAFSKPNPLLDDLAFTEEPVPEAPDAPWDVKKDLLHEADKIVNGHRRSTYGKPEDNFERIARFWQAYFDNIGVVMQQSGIDFRIGPEHVSPLMRLMKEARLCETPNHYDSFCDIIGYALTGAEINKSHP